MRIDGRVRRPLEVGLADLRAKLGRQAHCEDLPRGYGDRHRNPGLSDLLLGVIIRTRLRGRAIRILCRIIVRLVRVWLAARRAKCQEHTKRKYPNARSHRLHLFVVRCVFLLSGFTNEKGNSQQYRYLGVHGLIKLSHR